MHFKQLVLRKSLGSNLRGPTQKLHTLFLLSTYEKEVSVAICGARLRNNIFCFCCPNTKVVLTKTG